MIQENLFKDPVVTEPEDSNDSFRFGQLTETSKDAFSSELRAFFNNKNALFANRLSEIPTIRKYSSSQETASTPAESVLSLIQNHPDILESLPCVAIGVPSGTEKKLGIGSQFVDAVQASPRITGSNSIVNPISVNDGDQLVLETTPDGVNSQTSTFVMCSDFIPNLASVTLQDIVKAIEIQSLYVVPSIDYSNSQSKLRLSPGKLGKSSPNKIEVLSSSSSSLLSLLGFSVGQKDDCSNTDRPPANRYQMSGDYVVVLDVITEDTNQTREVTDLLSYFLTFDLSTRSFSFYGRSVLDESISGEFFQIILKSSLSFSTYEVPRGGSEQLDLIFGTRINIPITIVDYIDRYVQSPYSFVQLSSYKHVSPGVPTGDFADQSDLFGKIG